MTVRRFGDHDQAQARYVGNRASLEKEALDAVKKGELAAIKEAVVGVPGDPTGAARKVAEATLTSSGPVRDRLLNAGARELEQQVSEMAEKIERLVQRSRGMQALISSADLLAPLRDAVRDEDPKAIATALVDAVFRRGITYGEWRTMLERMSSLKTVAEADLTHLASRDAKRALQQDLVKLIYEPLIGVAKTS